MTEPTGLVSSINNNQLYNSSDVINNYFNVISEDDFQLFDSQICSPYHDIQSLVEFYSNTNIPLILSINIRSLSCNHSELMALINHLEINNVLIHAIALQETWNVKYTDLIVIPGYQKFYIKLRTFSNGGGVGIYVRDGITSKIVEIEHSFHERIFESITIELSTSSSKSYISSTVYIDPLQQSKTCQQMTNSNLF